MQAHLAVLIALRIYELMRDCNMKCSVLTLAGGPQPSLSKGSSFTPPLGFLRVGYSLKIMLWTRALLRDPRGIKPEPK